MAIDLVPSELAASQRGAVRRVVRRGWLYAIAMRYLAMRNR